MQDDRLCLIKTTTLQWLESHSVELSMVAGDASFRRYFRVQSNHQSWIIMDAPPDKEDCTTFIDVTRRLRDAGLHAPEILQADLNNGLLLLEDLGDTQYRPLITATTADECFKPLFKVMQNFADTVSADGLPKYDSGLLQKELDLFPDWYLEQHKQQPFSISEHIAWEHLCNQLILSAKQQKQVFVHRDFHSCNLLKTSVNNPGIIDYQDAVLGPISYDLVSLLWDRYISWPREKITDWCQLFRLQLKLDASAEDWQRQCDFMSLQRNLKIVGIFARLYYRDQKSGYLEMIPRFWDYCIHTLNRYPEFNAVTAALKQRSRAPE